ncbi:MAG: glycosyltransferase [Planctomycetota bacterium]|nr:MAG: glycosyltransferase [Planctomycetota bacterium]REK33992.1 MAG: glycosyltransferase [Planctomycetota bacterium]
MRHACQAVSRADGPCNAGGSRVCAAGDARSVLSPLRRGGLLARAAGGNAVAVAVPLRRAEEAGLRRADRPALFPRRPVPAAGASLAGAGRDGPRVGHAGKPLERPFRASQRGTGGCGDLRRRRGSGCRIDTGPLFADGGANTGGHRSDAGLEAASLEEIGRATCVESAAGRRGGGGSHSPAGSEGMGRTAGGLRRCAGGGVMLDGKTPALTERDCTVVIPQHNEAHLTVECVRSLRRAEGMSCDVLIVDDGSDSSQVRIVQRELPGERVLTQLHRGVTVAWNHGARAASSRFLVFLNNDTLSRGPWIDDLLAPLRSGEAVMTGVCRRRERAVGPELLARLPAQQFLEGWCFAAAASDVERARGFDESLRLYFSDTDVQLRLLEEAGLGGEALQIARGLPLSHAGHCSTRMLPDRRKIWRRDRERFIEKWTARLNGQDKLGAE